MIAWITQNYGTILVAAAVLALVALACVSLFRRRKKGGCPSGCSGCSYADACKKQ